MNEKHTTPRGSAFPTQAPLPKPEKAAEQAAKKGAEESAREASREFATHGDPSLQKKDGEQAEQDTPEDRRIRVRWERPADVAMRAAAAGLGKGADLHLAVHERLRALRAQAKLAANSQARRLPSAAMARRATGPDSPGSAPVSR